MANINNPKRVAVFIDHSNVTHLLSDMRKIDPLWVKWYDPRKLAVKLVGNRVLMGIYFYCSPAPSYLLQEGEKGERQYWKQMSYYEKVKKLPDLELKYARLSGAKGDLHEKNLDTQLNTDLLLLATANKYDTAILVANDGDYVSAVEGAKQLGRKVELVYFKHSISWHLKRICDVARRVRRAYFEELKFNISNNLK